MRIDRQLLFSSLIALTILNAGRCAYADDPLPSWNEGASKRAIIDFVERVTKPGGPDFVPVEQRIAVFDNDGTLWAEKPVYVQSAFAMERAKELAPQHPEWKDQQPFKAAIEGDYDAVADLHARGAITLINATHSGMTTEEFDEIVRKWLATAKNPRFQRPVHRSGLSADVGSAGNIFAPMDSKPTSYRRRGLNSCGSFPNSCTACRRSK